MRWFVASLVLGLLLPVALAGCAGTYQPSAPYDDPSGDDGDDDGDDDATGDDDTVGDDDTWGDDDTSGDDDTGSDDDTGDDDTEDPCADYRQDWPPGPYGFDIGDVLEDFQGMVDGQYQPRSLWDFYGDTSVIALVVHNAINT